MAEPKIRFPKFADDWKQYKIGEVGSFYYGRSCPKWSVTENATIPCVRYGELYTKFGSKIDKVYSYTNIQADKLRFSKGTEILIPRVGEDPMDYNHCTWLSIPNVAIGEMISVYNTKQNPLFTAIMFNATLRNEFAVRVEGFSVTNLYFEELKNITVYYPCLEEQQKIADFLSNVDEVIAQSKAEIKNLEQQKKAAMQKIFSQEVRFKREDGTEFPEWEIDTIGNRIIVTSCKRVHQSEWTEIGIPFYRAREIVALYNNEKISPLHISKDTYDTYSSISGKISKGDLLVTGVGTIGIPYLVKDTDVFYFKDGNIIWFQNDESSILGYYLFYVFGTDELKTQILNNSGKGTVHTYAITNAKETTIPIPCLEEQQKIADFLSAYDEAITCAKQELDKWKELKKGLLQQMFV